MLMPGLSPTPNQLSQMLCSRAPDFLKVFKGDSNVQWWLRNVVFISWAPELRQPSQLLLVTWARGGNPDIKQKGTLENIFSITTLWQTSAWIRWVFGWWASSQFRHCHQAGKQSMYGICLFSTETWLENGENIRKEDLWRRAYVELMWVIEQRIRGPTIWPGWVGNNDTLWLLTSKTPQFHLWYSKTPGL